MRTLLIETATQVCSVAVAVNGSIVAHRESNEPNAHSSHLAPFVEEMLAELGLTTKDLDAVGVSSGPGSYTGLRIGVSSAKGFCYALGKPLVAVPTLKSMASLYYRQHPDYNGMVCPMIDARRMECYTAFFGPDGMLRDTQADIITDCIYDEYLGRGEVVFVGDGASKCRDVLGKHPNARFDEAFCPAAEGMADEVENKLKRGETEDVAYFEPFYLKDFVAKKSVVHGLR
ncbi:MAG: tRNA (adenosine(37)-N6)-threonylcarbamoyltransferase complex dimerization subunit type 1 TsaB [Bacteroidales bacterium]|nr:tRNA (adenosine(37)-N6)-threonylcarbamoyltransferase complex dimerization subunit type 1 TsaB [Bacteroidales bacterium]